MKKVLSIMIAACMLVVGSISPAQAHATISLYGASASAGGYGVMFIRIPHGCDGKATNQVTITVPKEFQSIKAQQIAGWKSSRSLTSSSAVNLIWNGGSLPDDQFADFGVNVKYPAMAGTYYLKVSQKCGRDFVRWNQLPTTGVSLEYPAPSIVVAEASAAVHH
jgi:periplasmic copper chaperone A